MCSLHNNPTAHVCYADFINLKIKPRKVNTLLHSSSMSALQQESTADWHASEIGSKQAVKKSMRLKPVKSIHDGSQSIQYSEDASESEELEICHHKENKNMKKVLVLSSQQFYPKNYRAEARPKNLSTLSEPQYSILEASNPTLRSNS